MRKRIGNFFGCTALVFAVALSIAESADTQTILAGEEVVARVSPSVVLILVGQGAGRLTSEGSGVIVRSDGILLTAYHLIKNAREVQVRLKNGEVYDKVELIGFDERRDVAALKVPATGLPEVLVAKAEEASIGEVVYVVSNPEGLAWSASSGILSAARLADEVPGAGSGFRLLQFTAPVSPGSSGGALVDEKGRALGIVVASHQGQNVNFAVPVESVMGLASETTRTSMGAGNELTLRQNKPSPVRRMIASAKPDEILRSGRTIYINSKTMYFTPDVLAKELAKMPEFKAWGLLVVEDPQLADLVIRVDRPVFTYDFTYTVTCPRTSILLTSGKVTALDGDLAAGGIAKQIVRKMKTVRAESEPEVKKS